MDNAARTRQRVPFSRSGRWPSHTRRSPRWPETAVRQWPSSPRWSGDRRLLRGRRRQRLGLSQPRRRPRRHTCQQARPRGSWWQPSILGSATGSLTPISSASSPRRPSWGMRLI